MSIYRQSPKDPGGCERSLGGGKYGTSRQFLNSAPRSNKTGVPTETPTVKSRAL
jgi:hypothetical protein